MSAADAEADATLRLTHPMFVRLLTGQAGLKELLLSDEVKLEGSKLDLAKFFSLFDKPCSRNDFWTVRVCNDRQEPVGVAHRGSHALCGSGDQDVLALKVVSVVERGGDPVSGFVIVGHHASARGRSRPIN